MLKDANVVTAVYLYFNELRDEVCLYLNTGMRISFPRRFLRPEISREEAFRLSLDNSGYGLRLEEKDYDWSIPSLVVGRYSSEREADSVRSQIVENFAVYGTIRQEDLADKLFAMSEVSKFWETSEVIQEARVFCLNAGASAGSFLKNPYHNFRHCENVGKLAVYYVLLEEKYKATIRDEEMLAIAGLFHDYRHSGKPLSEVSDLSNVEMAIDGVRQFSKEYSFWNLDTYRIEKIIRNTAVSLDDKGKVIFQELAKDPLARYLRDADVTQLVTTAGFSLLVGLAQEMGVHR